MVRQARIASLLFLVLGCSSADAVGPPEPGPSVPVVAHALPMVTHDAGGEAAAECVEGWEQCNGNEVRQCARGAWSPWGACPYACIPGAAGSGCTGVCVPGTQRGNCNGPQTCDEQGLWQPAGASCASVLDAQASE